MNISILENNVAVKPDDLAARQELVSAYMDIGKNDAAIKNLLEIIQLWPNSADAYMILGTIYTKRCDWSNAGEMFNQVVRFQPNRIPALVGLAFVFSKLNNYKETIKYCRKALDLKPNAKKALQLLGFTLLNNGRNKEAHEVLRKYASLYPGSIDTDYFLAALSGQNQPAQSPEEYIVSTFDGYADTFEYTLLNVLQYSVPESLNVLLRKHIQCDGQLFDILDLGCGTGLMGEQLSDISNYLTGVDLSEKMLLHADKKNIYNELICKDILESLTVIDRKYDLVVATDVFIYIGELVEMFEKVYKIIKVGGVFAFSIEVVDGDFPYKLRHTGRYAQTLQYISDLANNNNFKIFSAEKIIVRFDQGESIDGYLFILMK